MHNDDDRWQNGERKAQLMAESRELQDSQMCRLFEEGELQAFQTGLLVTSLYLARHLRNRGHTHPFEVKEKAVLSSQLLRCCFRKNSEEKHLQTAPYN
jgi:hypothetical protein